ncbi:MAG: phosphotransferase [Christensenellales bacterium]
MKRKVQLAIQTLYNCPPLTITEAGKGFYGRVFKVTLAVAPFVLSVKLFDEPQYMVMQASEQGFMHSLGVVKVPKVLHVLQSQDINALVMEWAEGDNLGQMPLPEQPIRDAIGWEVVDQAVALHGVTNKTYGYLSGKQYPTWQAFYIDLSLQMLERISSASDRGLLDKEYLDLMTYAYNRFDKIFAEQVKAPSLLHGDLNIGNVIVQNNSVSALIDPMGVMWGDRELELFQFECSGSDKYDLLDKYFSINPPSKKFSLKNAYYKTFAEANHYARIDHPQDDNLLDFLTELERAIVKYNL